MLLSLKGVHLLLSYKCDLECDHCFVWGNPTAKGAFHIEQVKQILTEARKLETVTYVSVEGGEPFLYYPIMLRTVQEATRLGLHVEVLTNCYWATCQEDAEAWLTPLAEAKNVELSLSSDSFHDSKGQTAEVENAVRAALNLGIKVGIIAIENPGETPSPEKIGGAKVYVSRLMYKGRAAVNLIGKALQKPWREFVKCPYENLASPERVHVDPLGYVHVCQGISIGNAWQRPFSSLIKGYEPNKNAILEPLIRGGPVALVERFGLPHQDYYADACHLCYSARCMLRDMHPDTLGPDEMYGTNDE
jgi:hypothetical protein